MPVLSATGAGVRHRRRWLLRELDLVVEPGETVAIVGPPGSGRTSTLLALARRLRLSTGRVSLSGTAALGHVAGVDAPEPVLTVLEHVRERLALLGRPRREAASVPLYGLDPKLRGRDLTPYQKQVLGLVLARLARPAVIALDGVDAGLDAREQAELWGLIEALVADGPAVLVTARAVDPARVSRVVLLNDPQSAEPGRAQVWSAEEYAASLIDPPTPALAREEEPPGSVAEPEEAEEPAEKSGSVAEPEEAEVPAEKPGSVAEPEEAEVPAEKPDSVAEPEEAEEPAEKPDSVAEPEEAEDAAEARDESESDTGAKATGEQGES
ncbi:ABC transporter ATP-binding protein [Actinoplanes regularis]|uniref:ABC-2 type transport system ATP-binding protein n=1 Tax=Actinoplanes regularis TaxID=52697 RepID=A0A238UZ59_9ACTN|nr:ATP-binding cassette domain-containing protein [Actinoplanes regularis]GIE84158.1 hypothetical protein Are01nite_06380 [Actinoplanes regularis]SNR27582.1 ABC-2 type transport system ATP-binding protein [Actinoplanes regularis]